MKIIEPQEIPDWLHEEVNDYFISLLFEPKTILDIGANIGAYAHRAHKEWPLAQIICCEPMPFNVCHLRRNVPSATILSAAVREHSGIDDIYLGDTFVTGGFTQRGRQTQQTLQVECIAAKELPSCELVKIDTEGCEVEILENLSLENTRALLLEYHCRIDAELIKRMLSTRYDLATEDSDKYKEVGTLIFIRK